MCAAVTERDFEVAIEDWLLEHAVYGLAGNYLLVRICNGSS